MGGEFFQRTLEIILLAGLVVITVILRGLWAGASHAAFLFVREGLQRLAVCARNVRAFAKRNAEFREGVSLRLWTICAVGYVLSANLFGFGWRGAVSFAETQMAEIPNQSILLGHIAGGSFEFLAYLVLAIACFAWIEEWPKRTVFAQQLALCRATESPCGVCREMSNSGRPNGKC